MQKKPPLNRILSKQTTFIFLASCYWLIQGLHAAYAWKVDTVLGITIEGGSGQKPLSTLANKILTILYSFAGVSALIMIIVGAYRYITSAGNPKSVQEAKDTIQSAIYGLVLILIAYLLARTLGGFFGDQELFTNPNV